MTDKHDLGSVEDSIEGVKATVTSLGNSLVSSLDGSWKGLGKVELNILLVGYVKLANEAVEELDKLKSTVISAAEVLDEKELIKDASDEVVD